MRARGVPIPQKISVQLGAGLGSKMHTVVLNQNGAKETANNATLPEIASPKFGVAFGRRFGVRNEHTFSAKTSANETPTEPFNRTCQTITAAVKSHPQASVSIQPTAK